MRPRAAAQVSTAASNAPSRASARLSSPQISARMTRRATARSALPVASRTRFSAIRKSLMASGRPVRLAKSIPLPRHAQLMREDVLLRPASEIKQNAMRQEIKASAGQLLASLARQHRVKSAAQRVQMQHVRSGIAKLLFGQGLRSPVRALLLFRQVDVQ